MEPDRWTRIKSVVADALEEETARRAEFVARRCKDDTTIRREVESMLAHASSRLDECADAIAVRRSDPLGSRTGERLGAYEIVRELGRGGMGRVFLARRADQNYEKDVAIKILKRGTDTDEVLRRFRAERRMLAGLDHPNIARLLDAGTTDDGLPYFVMEYVAGSRVTDFCREQNLSTRERLQLFLKISEAVRLAHQKLIVHRDIKPANILVSSAGEPKLLDFGIAKLITPDTGTAEMTIAQSQRFTAACASPEQARGEAVTTLTDVYALGGLLYQMLTGQPPHRFTSDQPSHAEIVRVIAEQQAERPSAVVADVKVRRELRGDLDNILLTALRKVPSERYGGVGAFAGDVQHYLDGRPVRARPLTASYRAVKFLKRNTVASAATAALLLALLVAGTLSIWHARRAAWHAQRAARHFTELRQLANSFLFEFHDAVAPLQGSTPVRRLVVERAVQYLDRLAHEATADWKLQLELANGYLKVGDVQGKPYTPNLGDVAGAIRSYTAAVTIAEPLVGRRQHAAAASSIAAKAYAALAAVEARTNRIEAARQHNTRALALTEQLLVNDPVNAEQWRSLIVSCHLGLGDGIEAANHRAEDPAAFHAALDHYRRGYVVAEELRRGHSGSVERLLLSAKSCARVAFILAELGRKGDSAAYDECFQLHAQALELERAAAEVEPENTYITRNIADEMIMTAYAYTLAQRDLPVAAEYCERALATENALAAADRSNAEAQQDLSFAHFVTGRVFQLRADRAHAKEHYELCLSILEPLVAAQPNNVETAFDMSRAREGLAQVAAEE